MTLMRDLPIFLGAAEEMESAFLDAQGEISGVRSGADRRRADRRANGLSTYDLNIVIEARGDQAAAKRSTTRWMAVSAR